MESQHSSLDWHHRYVLGLWPCSSLPGHSMGNCRAVLACFYSLLNELRDLLSPHSESIADLALDIFACPIICFFILCCLLFISYFYGWFLKGDLKCLKERKASFHCILLIFGPFPPPNSSQIHFTPICFQFHLFFYTLILLCAVHTATLSREYFTGYFRDT